MGGDFPGGPAAKALALSVQGARVRSQVRDLAPVCCNLKISCLSQLGLGGVKSIKKNTKMNGQKCGNLSTPEIPKAETGPEKFPNLLLSTLLEHMISLIKCFFQTEGGAGQGRAIAQT